MDILRCIGPVLNNALAAPATRFDFVKLLDWEFPQGLVEGARGARPQRDEGGVTDGSPVSLTTYASGYTSYT
jgi:hypothetical protein